MFALRHVHTTEAPPKGTPPRAEQRSSYRAAVVDQLPRAMALQDFNPRSATYGCCDRNFWQYKTLASFPAATYQQLAVAFALAATHRQLRSDHDEPGELAERALAACRFWAKSQRRNGSVDEWYRHEHSYCAAAFTTFGAAEALLWLRDDLSQDDRSACLPAVERGCRWLADRFNEHVMNQNLAACGAFWSAHLLTGNDSWRTAFQRTWTRTLESFHSEGWFSEYGGADCGYTTLALDLLACLHHRGCKAEVLPVAQKICRFLQAFVTPGGLLGGRLGSRGTTHAFPFGAEYFSGILDDAALLAAGLVEGFAQDNLPLPRSVDDRYFAYFYLPQFAWAVTCQRRQQPLVHADRVIDLPASGFRIDCRERYGVVFSLRRQGAFSICESGQPTFHNLGYWCQTAGGERWASCAWNGGAVDFHAELAGAWAVRGLFSRVEDELPLTRHALSFHVLTEWPLRWQWLAERFHRFVKQRKIVSSRLTPLAFERRCQFLGDQLLVTDRLEKQPGCAEITAVSPVDDVEVHSPSGRMAGRTRRISASDAQSRAWARRLERFGTLVLQHVYAPSPQRALEFRTISVVE